MIKRVLIAAAIMIATPGFLFSQEFFVTFEQGADARTSSSATADLSEGTGTAYVYSDFKFNAFDLLFTTADTNVISFTSAFVPNSEILAPPFVSGVRFDSTPVQEASGDSGRMFGVSVLELGVDPAFLGADADYDADAQANLIGSIDFDLVGVGVADITLALGANGVIELPDNNITPTLTNGSLTVTGVPEPSSAMLLVLGTVGLVARRRKA